MPEFKQYRKKAINEFRPWKPGDDLTRVSIGPSDLEAGSPKEGDMIGRSSEDPSDQWLVNAEFFAKNYEPV